MRNLSLASLHLVFFLALFSQLAFAQEKFVVEKTNGCKIYAEFMKLGVPEQSVSWSGSCKDGDVHGNGIMNWYAGDEIYWTDEYSSKSGITLEQGKPKVILDTSIVKLKLAKCEQDTFGYRNVEISGVDEVDLRYNSTVDVIFNAALKFAMDECPVRFRNGKEDASNISVQAYVAGKKAIHARTYSTNVVNPEDGAWEWREYENKLTNLAFSDAQRAAARYNKKLLQEKKNAQAKEAESKAKIESEELEMSKLQLKEWMQTNDILEFVTIKKLFTNPYLFQNKTIGITSTFESMTGPSEALFGNAFSSFPTIIESVPNTLFSESGEWYVLAVKVIGQKEYSAMGQTANVPHLEYVDSLRCTSRKCEKYVSVSP